MQPQNNIIPFIHKNLLSLQFDEYKTIEDFLLYFNLKVRDLHELYCKWYNLEKSLLRGRKQTMLHQLITAVQSTAFHLSITRGKEWSLLSPEEKYKQYINEMHEPITETCNGYCRSNCCDAPLIVETDICSKCNEHADNQCSICEEKCKNKRNNKKQ